MSVMSSHPGVGYRDIKKVNSNGNRGNPNNPTGALYPVEILEQIIEIARQNDLIVFSDEIYDKITYDGAVHTSTASLADDVLFITINGLSKTYRVAGFRVGWMVVSGRKSVARDYIEGLTMLACAPVQQRSGQSMSDRTGRLPEHL